MKTEHSKSDILSMLADLGACKKDLILLKQDPRDLLDIFIDPRAKDRSELYVVDENGYDYIYDMEWIVDGPYGDLNKNWTDYTYSEIIDMIVKEHDMWLNHREIWDVPRRWHEITEKKPIESKEK